MLFLLDDGNVLFSAALALMLLIAVMEGALTLIGFGLSQMLDNLLPDLDLDADLPEGSHPNGLSRLLGWMRFGQVPALVILIVFLTTFGLLGIGVQMALQSLVGATLPTWLAAIPVLFVTLPCVRATTGLMQHIAIKDETEAISSNTFVGQVATITLGEAKQGSPAEARFTDKFGTTHYTMVEPDTDEVFSQGDQVLLVEKIGSTFKAIANANEHLNQQQ